VTSLPKAPARIRRRKCPNTNTSAGSPSKVNFNLSLKNVGLEGGEDPESEILAGEIDERHKR
jgi:hypothetical protein